MSIMWRRPSQAPRTALVILGGLHFTNPLRICRKPISQNRPSCAHTSHMKIIWFRFAVSHNSFPFRSFHHVSFTVTFSVFLQLIFQYHLVNRKPLGKTTKASSSSTCCCRLHLTTRVNLDAIPTRTRTHDFTLQRCQVGAVRLLFSSSLLYTRIWYDPPGRPILRFQTAVIHVRLPSAADIAHISTVSPIKFILLIPHFDFFRRVTLPYLLAGFRSNSCCSNPIAKSTPRHVTVPEVLLCRTLYLCTSLMSPISTFTTCLSGVGLRNLRSVSPDISAKYLCNCTSRETVILTR